MTSTPASAPAFPAWGDRLDSRGDLVLRPTQKSGAIWLATRTRTRRGRILGDPVGFGKGRTASAACRLWAEGPDCHMPVTFCVCPAIARLDLRRELREVWPEAGVLVMGDNDRISVEERQRRLVQLYTSAEAGKLEVEGHPVPFAFIISTYEMAMQFVEAPIPQLLGPFLADEAHQLKKAGALRSRLLRPLAARSEILMLLTGTPVHDKPRDLHNLLDLCAPGRIPSLYTWARKYFLMKVGRGGFGETIGPLLDREALNRDTEEFLLQRTVEEAYGTLPPSIWKVVQVEGTRKRELRPPKDEAEIMAGLRNSVPYKLRPCVELVQSLAEPVVVYVYEREHARVLAGKMRAAGLSVTLATGDTTAAKRTAAIEQWKNGSTTVLLCTMDAVRESATLTRASAMVFADFHYMHNVMAQNAGRIAPSRQPAGQRRPVRYYLLAVEGSIDEQVADRLAEKMKDAEGVAGQGSMSGLQAAISQVHPRRQESMEEMLADLTARINARASRMEGLL